MSEPGNPDDLLFDRGPRVVTEVAAAPDNDFTQTVPVWVVTVTEQARIYIVPAATKDHAKLLVLGRLFTKYRHLSLDWAPIERSMRVHRYGLSDARLLAELGTTIKGSF